MHCTIPKAALPLRSAIIATAKVLQERPILSMTRKEFISEVLKASGGHAKVEQIGELYDALTKEAF